jgi:hypothetical protein
MFSKLIFREPATVGLEFEALNHFGLTQSQTLPVQAAMLSSRGTNLATRVNAITQNSAVA